MTAEQFFALGETEARLELVDGVVSVSPSPLPRHQKTVQELFLQLSRVAELEVFLDTDVWFDPSLVYRPDISVYRVGRLAGTPDRLAIVPDLIIEVLSPGSRPMDLLTKRDDYDRFGVSEYFAIDPDTARVYHWARQGARLIERPAEGERIASAIFQGLEIDIEPIRRLSK